jgi:hypothetical protein
MAPRPVPLLEAFGYAALATFYLIVFYLVIWIVARYG